MILVNTPLILPIAFATSMLIVIVYENYEEKKKDW
jgi:hypothetical protein